MKEKVRALEYVMSVHAEEEMEDDELSILDVEHIILTGGIIERQKDQETGERCNLTCHRKRPRGQLSHMWCELSHR
jgi:hypothetical protein